ncbi:MAG: sulfotransferase domain-containing protein [Cyclobacteriaceae bacterium]
MSYTKLSFSRMFSARYYILLNQFLNLIGNAIKKRQFKLRIKIFRKLFIQREDDIYIVSYMKSGTTLMQMIVYQLTTDGQMDFSHIYDVSPFLENELNNPVVSTQNLNKLESPRIIKTHFRNQALPSQLKGKVICVTRNGMDVAVSMYHHYKNYHMPDLEWDAHINQWFADKYTWFDHVFDWKENKRNYNVHYVAYEDIINDPRNTIEGIARFLELNPTEEVYDRVVERCSFSFMKTNQEKFGLDTRGIVTDQFIRKGKANHGHHSFSNDQKAKFKKMFTEVFGSYEEDKSNTN